MALTLVVNGQAISHNDLDQCINRLQQPAGGSEASKYVLSGNVYVANGYLSVYISSESRTTVPVSCSIDTVDVTKPSYMTAPSTGHVTMGGVQIFAQFTAINGGGATGGNCTFNY